MSHLQSERVEVPEDIAAISHFFYEKGWSDGLPIIPPTEERVLSVLQRTQRKPEEVIGLIPPRWAEATVEKIAINTTMAGCLPEHLPVIITAVEAMVEKKFNLYGVQATTHPCAPLLVINGPFRKQLGINCSYGALGPGTLANAVIGRAIRLILLNIGGATPGKVDKATHGQPGKYTYVIGENEEQSPWEPLSIERGFKPGQSTVTVVAAEGPHNVNDHWSISAEGIITAIAGTLATQGNNNILYQVGEPLILLGPEHAETIAKDGYKKKDVNPSTPRPEGWGLLRVDPERRLPPRPKGRGLGAVERVKEFIFEKAKIPKKAFSKENQESRFANFPEDALIPVTSKPENMMVVVAGGAGKHSMVIPTFGNTSSITKVI